MSAEVNSAGDSLRLRTSTVDQAPPAYSTLPAPVHTRPNQGTEAAVLQVPEATGKLLQTSVVVPTSDHGTETTEPLEHNTFGDKNSRVAFIQKVLAIKLLQSLGVGGIMYCFVKNDFNFIVAFIVVGTLAHASTVALMAWCSRARRQNPYTYMFLVAQPLTFVIFIGAVTNGFILQAIFRAWINLCVTMLAMLLYAVFSLHTARAPSAAICVCITAVTHTALYAMTVLLSYVDPFPVLGFTIVAALECAYVGNELALMCGACDVPYRERLGPTDYANAALNLHIDYFYFITKFMIPKCR